MARSGARALSDPNAGTASAAWRGAVVRARTDSGEEGPDVEVWVREDGPTSHDRAARRPTPNPARPRRSVPKLVTEELAEVAGARPGVKLSHRLADAVHAYDRDRYQDALNIIQPLARAVPEAPAVRELLGLTLYRLGRWRPALEELEEYRKLSDSADQVPVMMDCLRALHRDTGVDELWDDLRHQSAEPEVVAEARIVMASALADRGQLPDAVKLLQRATSVRNPKLHHLRQWYALADLYERAGDIPRARDLFRRIDTADPAAFDTRDRLRALR